MLAWFAFHACHLFSIVCFGFALFAFGIRRGTDMGRKLLFDEVADAAQYGGTVNAGDASITFPTPKSVTELPPT